MPLYGWVAVAILVTGLGALLIGGQDGVLLGVDPGQIAALTAMLALLVYLGGGMIGQTQPVGKLVRHLIVWGGLLAALIIGYQVFQGLAV